ncbi:two-component sensor histidine kinase [Planomonospora parontospora subsp. parontospora]|uniref:Signal transduction histidine-protein kinase/phosphatase MprB n=2 Tax=Planomonospora parontospora TaxID=58119 RepID=A0AA37BFW7_9ACTN|nr:HAMP domain-containing sensor histidine kinase [Planomonospora parontospora]GGK64990.1 two-component sensor histidine kinase [Planomonospora parontospora]GII08029.1 two-component sensor histidine kinase [Planomonospora parontospora subsp. parontospora]
MRRTLALLALAGASMIALAFLIPLGIIVKEIAHTRAISEAERQASALVPVLAITLDPSRLPHALASSGARDRIAVHLPGGGTVGTVRAPAATVAAVSRLTRADTVETGAGYLLLRPVALDGGRTVVVEVFVPAEELTRGVAQSWAVLAGLAVVLAAGSVLVADRLGVRMVRAARRLGRAASSLGAGDLSVRIRPEGPPELVTAAEAFNTMADRVVQLLAAEREMAADLSHRLRTPLTALRLSLDHLGPEAEQSRHSLSRLESEVDQIIAAARAPSRAPEAVSCDAAEVLRERLTFWSALAEDQQRPWELIGADAPVRVPVPAAELSAVVDALLGNVFRHTPQGTAFTVTLHQGSGTVGVLIADAGPGIPDPTAALRRGASGAGSTGLGLDIARRLAESSGGDLRIDASSLGGARVQLWFRTDTRDRTPRTTRRLVGSRWSRRNAGV